MQLSSNVPHVTRSSTLNMRSALFTQPQADCFLLASSGSWQSNKIILKIMLILSKKTETYKLMNALQERVVHAVHERSPFPTNVLRSIKRDCEI